MLAAINASRRGATRADVKRAWYLSEASAGTVCLSSTPRAPLRCAEDARAELLFNLLAERYERRSVIVTTNLPFGEWVKVFGDDEKLTTALLDRLAHHATVIATKGRSFRMRKKEEGKTQKEPEENAPTTLPKRDRKA